MAQSRTIQHCPSCGSDNDSSAIKCNICTATLHADESKNAHYQAEGKPQHAHAENKEFKLPLQIEGLSDHDIQVAFEGENEGGISPENKPKADWGCMICLAANSANNAHCSMCHTHFEWAPGEYTDFALVGELSAKVNIEIPEKKINAQSIKMVNKPVPAAVQVFDWKKSEWRCNQCYFTNGAASPSCGLCSAEASKVAQQLPSKSEIQKQELNDAALLPAAFISLLRENKSDAESKAVIEQVRAQYEHAISYSDAAYQFALERLNNILAFRKSHNSTLLQSGMDLRQLLTRFNTQHRTSFIETKLNAENKIVVNHEKFDAYLSSLKGEDFNLVLPLYIHILTGGSIEGLPYYDLRTGVFKEPSPMLDLTPLARAIQCFLQGKDTIGKIKIEDFIRKSFTEYTQIKNSSYGGYYGGHRRRGAAVSQQDITQLAHLGEELICILRGVRARTSVQKEKQEAVARENFRVKAPEVLQKIREFEAKHPTVTREYKALTPEQIQHIMTAEVLMKEQGNGTSYVSPAMFETLISGGLHQFSAGSNGCIRILPPDLILSSKDIAANPQLQQAGWVILRSGGFNGRMICMFIGGGQLSKGRDIRALITEYDEGVYQRLYKKFAPSISTKTEVTAQLGTTAGATAVRSNTEKTKEALTDLNTNRISFGTAMLLPTDAALFSYSDMDGPYWDSVVLATDKETKVPQAATYVPGTHLIDKNNAPIHHSGDVWHGPLVQNKKTGNKHQFILQVPQQKGEKDSYQFSIVCSWNTPITRAHERVGWQMHLMSLSDKERAEWEKIFKDKSFSPNMEKFKKLINDKQRAYSLPSIMAFSDCNTYAMQTVCTYYCARLGRSFLISLDMPVPFNVQANHPDSLQKVNQRCKDIIAFIESEPYQRYLESIYRTQRDCLRTGRTPTDQLDYVSQQHDELRKLMGQAMHLKETLKIQKNKSKPTQADLAEVKKIERELNSCLTTVSEIRNELQPHFPLGYFNLKESDPSVFCGNVKPSAALLDYIKLQDEYKLLGQVNSEVMGEQIAIYSGVSSSLGVTDGVVDPALAAASGDMRTRYVRRRTGPEIEPSKEAVSNNYLSNIRYETKLTNQYLDELTDKAKQEIRRRKTMTTHLLSNLGIYKNLSDLVLSYSEYDIRRKKGDKVIVESTDYLGNSEREEIVNYLNQRCNNVKWYVTEDGIEYKKNLSARVFGRDVETELFDDNSDGINHRLSIYLEKRTSIDNMDLLIEMLNKIKAAEFEPGAKLNA